MRRQLAEWEKVFANHISDKGITKKELLKAIQNTIAQTDSVLTSEYIRGELVKKGILEDGGKEFCAYDPSTENDKEQVALVYSQEDLIAERANKK